MNIIEKIDREIKLIWKEDIFRDYNNDFILKEDTLKNAFYHHLRLRLGDGFFTRHRIRIFSEYYLRNKERADLAIVRLRRKNEIATQENHLRDRVEEVLEIIEFKSKNYMCGINPFLKEIEKVRKYIRLRSYQKCQFYLGFIHETEYAVHETSWLDKRQQESWAIGRLTELSAFYEAESGNFDMKILSYNRLNPDLNSKM